MGMIPEGLPDLATPADAERFGYATLDAGKLARASLRVREAAGVHIAPVASLTATMLRPGYLPGRPVRSVASVTRVDGGGDVPHVLLPGGLLRFRGGPVAVEYEAGYEQAPDSVVEIVCAVASRMADTNDGVAMGVTQESAGGEMVGYGAEAYRGVTWLTSGELGRLRRLFPRRPGTIRVGAR